MKFNKKDVIVGFLIIVIVVGGVLIYKKLKTPKPLSTQAPVSVTFKKDFEEAFKLDIPDDVNSIDLKDVSGGDSRGMATDNEVLVDAVDPEAGFFYQGWLEKDGNLISIGKLQMAKGGWLLEYGPKGEGVNKIIVSLEKTFDNKIEKRILEGSF